MGRRARQDLFGDENLSRKNSPSASLGEDEDSQEKVDHVPPPKPPRRQGGWADDPVLAPTKPGREGGNLNQQIRAPGKVQWNS
ncbi:intraflagellar transport protein 43 homolog [Corvus kubaryi]|uniref:intraflagellar transport protein 43 homolog n=1 Tax=Corvus kubaryi TaxID=68294 RepID=UPI001C0495EA|nr:intraflagellar transport protein 43 homolog [Corvus kubaryi]